MRQILLSVVGVLPLLHGPALAERPELLYRSSMPILAVAASRHVVAWPDPDGTVHIQRAEGFPEPRVLVSPTERLRLFADLDAPSYESRQVAFQALRTISRSIVPELRTALADAPSRESRTRLAALLKSVSPTEGDQHAGPILALAISRDEQTIVSGGKDGKLRLWSVSSGSVLRVIPAHGESVTSVGCSPVEDIFVSGGGDNLVHVWTMTGQRIATLRGHESSVHDLAFSPDGQSLASAGGFDRRVLLWDVESWSPRERLAHPPNHEPLCVAFLPDGTRLASSGYGGTIHCWQAGALMWSTQASKSTVRCLAVRSDGTIMFGNRDGELGVCAWDCGNGVASTLVVHVGSLRDLARRENEVISVGDDGKVQRHVLAPLRS